MMRRAGAFALAAALVAGLGVPMPAALAAAPAACGGAACATGSGEGGVSELVTAIVQLDEQPAFGWDGGGLRLFGFGGESAQARHARLREAVRAAAGGDGGQAALSEADADGADGADGTDGGTDGLSVERDYYHALDGFAMRVPAGSLEAIRKLDGVKAAFVERAFSVPEDTMPDTAGLSSAKAASVAASHSEPAGEVETNNADSRAMTGAGEVGQKGDGQVVCVIDTGVDVGHEAFGGKVDTECARWTRESIAETRSQLSCGGAGASYVSDKIPFAWDYGDNDADPHGINSHGTHVAGIVAANAGKVRGTAPNAQLLAMRVARDYDGQMVDSAVLAALDDAAMLAPDVINMSLGTDGGFYDEATNVYADVFDKLETGGCTLCISAGNAYHSAYRGAGLENRPLASDPDVGVIATPAAHAESFAIASCENMSAADAGGDAGSSSGAGGEDGEGEDGPAVIHMSDFSSWGVTPEMKLKPELTAPGGNIYSSVYDNGYELMSGTSMSSPHAAGLSALVNEYVHSDLKFSKMSADERHDAVTQLLMSTARPVADAELAGSFCSPRQQGAGLADAHAAVTSEVFLTVEGADDVSRPKAELGSSARGTWDFTVTLHNLGASERHFRPQTAALSELIEDGRFQTRSANYADNGIAVAYGGGAYDAASGEVRVPAGGAASCTVSLRCEDAFKQRLADKGAENGSFVDGFAMLASADGGVDLSVPFVGFYGDWGRVPVFDVKAGEGQAHVYASRLYSMNGTYNAQLGVNPFKIDETGEGVDLSRAVISDSNVSGQYVAEDVLAAPTSVAPHTGLLRSPARLEYLFRNPSGAEVKRYMFDNVTKSLLYSGFLFPEAELSWPQLRIADETGAVLPDGIYELEERATVAGSGAVQSERFSFRVDTKGPQVSEPRVVGSGEQARVTFTVSDESCLAAVDFLDTSERGYALRLDGDKLECETDAAGRRVYRIDCAWGDLQRAGVASAEDIAVCAWDYGMNGTRAGAGGGQVTEDDGIERSGSVVTGYHGTKATVEIPDGVTRIGREAFANSRVRYVRIPASVRVIEDRAFKDASALTNVSIEDTVAAPSMLGQIGEKAFSGSGIESIKLPDSVSTVGTRAFENTALELADFGARARVFADTFDGHNPAHLVMRGGSRYECSYESSAAEQPMTSAWFAEGVARAEFMRTSEEGSGSSRVVRVTAIATPQLMVVPATMRTLVLAPDQTKADRADGRKVLLRYRVADVRIFAKPNTTGWETAKKALESIGADPDVQLRPLGALDAATAAQFGADGLFETHAGSGAAGGAAAVGGSGTAAGAGSGAGAGIAGGVGSAVVDKPRVTAADVRAAAAGGAKTLTLGPKVKRIAKRAFSGTKVTTLVVKSTRLTKAGVKGCLKGSRVKVVKAPKAKKKAYKKLFTKKVAGKKAAVK